MKKIPLYTHSLQQTPNSTTAKGDLLSAFHSFIGVIEYRDRSPRTIESYKQKLTPFLNWCNNKLIINIGQFTPEILRSFFAGLSADHTPGGVHGYYRVIHAFFSWWFDEYEPQYKNPFSKARMPKPKLTALDPVPNEAISKLISTCKQKNFFDLRDLAIISVLFDTGIRANELRLLDIADIGDRSLHIRFGKGRQIRRVHFGQQTRKNIALYLDFRQDTEPALFINAYGIRISHDNIRQMLWSRSEKAGLSKHYMPHAFRRAFAINCLLNGWDIYRLRDEMGHNSLSVLERYLKVVDFMRADLSKLASPLDNLKNESKTKIYK